MANVQGSMTKEDRECAAVFLEPWSLTIDHFGWQRRSLSGL
jgi:hypothetical protein